MIKETIDQIISRIWGEQWNKLPIDYRINLRYNYKRTLTNRGKRGIINTKQQAKKD